jgi:hypothetical protein
MAADEKKPDLIIDEDWKSQVERERAELEQAEKVKAAEPAAAATSKSPKESTTDGGPLPPATLSSLATILGTQALIALVQIVDPASGKPHADFEQAQHFIDLLAVLETKTAGSRTPEESQLFESMLHELRMIFVAVRK